MIKLEQVSKKYGEQIIFDHLNLEIKEHSTTCIMAPSGRGKTTLLRILMGLETIDSGTVEGLAYAKLSVMFQENRLCEHLDVYANIVLPHIGKNSLATHSKSKLDKALREIGLTDYQGKKVSELSGGMKRRIALLRAVLASYDVLLLDEPFQGLDQETRKLSIDFLLKHTKEKTVILISHDPMDAKLMNAKELLL